MGMDLFSKNKPRNKPSLYYRFNWSGWGNVCNFLSNLGCDLSEFSGMNDGELVSPDSCLSIADTIQVAFDAGRLLESYKVEQSGDGHCLSVKALYDTDTHKDEYENEELVVDYKNKRIIREAKKFPDSFLKNIEPKNAPLFMGAKVKKFMGSCIEVSLAPKFLKGDLFSQAMLINWNIKEYDNPWSRLKYYLGFGDFCRGCAKLGGFTQC